MDYFAETSGQEFVVSVSSDQDFTLDGTPQLVDLRPVDGNGLFSMLLDGVSHTVFIKQAADAYSIKLNGVTHQVRLEDEKSRFIRTLIKADKSKLRVVEVRAPMPGLVTKMNVVKGEKITKGSPLLIIEAMKMENEIRAAADGVVKEILIQEKVSVEKDAVLLLIE